jgi:hypothetical protein
MKDILSQIQHNHARECDFYSGCALCELQRLAPTMAATLIDVAVFLITHEGPKAYQQADHLSQMTAKISEIMQKFRSSKV